jgi:hypothetical protein
MLENYEDVLWIVAFIKSNWICCGLIMQGFYL